MDNVTNIVKYLKKYTRNIKGLKESIREFRCSSFSSVPWQQL